MNISHYALWSEYVATDVESLQKEVEEFDVSVDEGSQRFEAFSDPNGSGRNRRLAEGPACEARIQPVAMNLHVHPDRGVDLYV